ncbi:putative pyridoxine 5'-phosphate oxidase superfamily flavin-nucleotide-binding protein [Variovorax boronicumulans]|uniref:Pyridoxine 5'-phosphate oxidase superfamily flavin-nucleotide-binding protein n=1 Tax=Variovorax boronicumulans TaxID=436515 RepID=A0AAW8E698_9BURK|nr:pyridoxamine 5'-phosphate oxidase family protein [Variovorax boronicumulans]MDP9882011.1 putative pyridoxine 5'-phosphate oxidase superfamily flavin-nucleotide-binding protein [Variovorax boronicumulans]MDP9914401.1 putative pyridoxine 5'-phosphate oxidase superfamily flavin-nucleotide-binding protein [Variovorax boronicumulans]MDP9927110.1 putative pyridoxine 5'-phosphate oxidase superfamily flavin-nucleotide-binding protein [Variovorax boronicumulans]
MIAAPFHAGERALQSLVGAREQMEAVGPRVIRDYMPDQHREFFALLPFLVVGSLDADLQPWASMLAAPAGFAHSPDATHLRIDALPGASDPLAAQLAPGATLGLLGIQPHTRRRNRMNGTVEAFDAAGFMVEVQQSFGNCPRYIQAREPVFAAPPANEPAVQWLDTLDLAAERLIGASDTLFISTAYPDAVAVGDAADARSHGVDVSHRGGRPGFVRVDAGGVLTVPDFNGNRFFNTLGNLQAHPRAGLLFVDFDTGELLHLSATAEIVTEGPEVAAFEGAERLMRFHVTRALRRPAALPLRWGEAALSPHLAGTGRWAAH